MKQELALDTKIEVGTLYEVVNNKVYEIDKDCYETEMYLPEDLEPHHIGQGIIWESINDSCDADLFNPDLWMVVSRGKESAEKEDFFYFYYHDADEVIYVIEEDQYYEAEQLLNAKSDGYYCLINLQYVSGSEQGKKYNVLLHSITPIQPKQ